MPNLDDLIKKEYPPEDQKIYFDTIPLIKVIVMSILTFNLYFIAWSYQMWSKLEDKGYNISAFWRGSVFWLTNLSLLPIIGRYLKKAANIEIGGTFLALAYLLIYRFTLPMLLDYFHILMPNNDSMAILFSFLTANFLTALPLIYVQSKINKANKKYCNGGYVDGWNKTDIIFILGLAILAFLYFYMFINTRQF